MTITQPALTQVKRGNPKAIEALLRQQLRRKGLRVQVVRKENQLCIYFTGKVAPLKQELLPLVDRALRHVGTKDINVARVRAYRNGVREAVWSGRVLVKRSLRRSGVRRWLATGRGKAIAAGAGLLTVLLIGSLLRGSSEPQVAVEGEAGPVVTDAANPGTADDTAAEAEAAVPDDGLVRISGLPAHRLREQDVFDSKRVQLDAKDDISRDECRALAAHYLDAAGANGKVVVQKPNPKSPWNGKRAPYCANNLDGQGTFFNDEYFDDIP